MSNTELKVIRAALRSICILILLLYDGREMPARISKMFYGLSDNASSITGMIEEGNYD